MDNLTVTLTRVGQKVHFEAVSGDHPDLTIPFDYVPPIGEGNGLAGLEALLMSFCGCVSTAIVALLQRQGKHISSYTVHAEGIRREQPISLSKILFHVDLVSDNASNPEIEAVLALAEQISPVWIAIRGNVEVETSYTIREIG